MKTRAFAVDKINNSKTFITAFDAIYLREFDSENYKNLSFYYAEDSKLKTELVPKFLKKNNTAFFAFKSGNAKGNGLEDEGETLTHFVAKKALAKLKSIHLIDVETNNEYFFTVKSGENEKRIVLDKNYYADVYYELDKMYEKNMMQYLYRWYEKLIIEVCVTHKVTNEKREAFYNNNLPVFEVLIPESTRDKFKLEKQTGLSKTRIDKAIMNMQRMFEKGIKGKFISNPKSREYIEMCKYKEEIEKFKSAKEKAVNECIQAEKRLEIIELHLKTAESNKKYYDTIEDKVKQLEEKIKELEKEIQYSKNHPMKHLITNIGRGKEK